MTPETEALIARVMGLDAKATKGPWHVSTNRHLSTDGEPWGDMEAFAHPAGGCGSPPTGMNRITWKGEKGCNNAVLIATYRTAAPQLATALEAESKRADAAEAMHAASCATSREYWQRLEAAEAKLRCPIGLDATPKICSAGTCLVCLADHNKELRAELAAAEAKLKVARDALEHISLYNYCLGPGCLYCEEGSHPKSAEALKATLALTQTTQLEP